MWKPAWSLALAFLGLASCVSRSSFHCTDSAACQNGTQAGVCEPTGFCSFPAPGACVSGRRYGSLAGDGLADTCVLAPGGDGGPSDGSLDGRLPDGQVVSDGAPADAARDGSPPIDAAPPTDGAPNDGNSAPPLEPLSSIAGGTFMMGCAPTDTMCESDESPRHQVTLSAYQIQHHPVTQGDYKKCMNAGVCAAPLSLFNPVSQASFPVINVTWNDAVAYCNWNGGRRLPTEAEWEFACRGSSNLIYPWGDTPAPTCTLANFMGCGSGGSSMLMAIDTHQAGQSSQGPEDMAGNASNWVADWVGTYPSGPVTNPQGPGSGSARGLRAGNYLYPIVWLRCSNRHSNPPAAPDANDAPGFRCAK